MQYGAQGARIGGSVGRKTGRFFGKRAGKFAGRRAGGAAAGAANVPGKRRLARLEEQRQEALAREAEKGSPEELFRRFLYGSAKKLPGLAINLIMLGPFIIFFLVLFFIVALPLWLINTVLSAL